IRSILSNRGEKSEIIYRLQKFYYQSPNKKFKHQNPSFPLPPDKLLFETGQINYPWYLKSGQEAAAEFTSFFHQFHRSPAKSILDWGCGVGRVTRHLPHFFPEANITGVDINAAYIHWLQKHIPDISFLLASENTLPPASSFDLIIGTSVLTHLPADQQAPTLLQLHDWLEPQGIACISTRGKYYHPELSSHQLRQLEYNGLLTCGSTLPGSRGMRTYHTPNGMRQLLPTGLQILLYYDGKKFPGVLGGQDLWIIKKTAQQENPTAQ
ncbi:MAG: class I SAM-dependent methyltransferase, partial [Sediminibacterium sp.]